MIPRLRILLEQEIANEERAGNEFLRALCLLLWLNADPQDARRMLRQSSLASIAGCMVDEDFLACGGLEQTRAHPAICDTRAAHEALKSISKRAALLSKDERNRL
jgi:hypothetical protein